MTYEFNFIVNKSGIPIVQGIGFKELMEKSKNKRGVMSVLIFDERDPSQIIGYYKVFILPAFQKAYKTNENKLYTLDQVEAKIWELSAVVRDKEIDINKLSVIEIWTFIEELKMIASTDFNTYIP
jgi:hypothetical protein